VVIATGGDDEPASPAKPPESEAQSPEELETQFAERDRQRIESMTAEARQISDGLAPTMAAFNRAIRNGGAPPRASAQWLSQTRRYAATFRESVSGETATNVARLGLRASLEGLVNAIELYRLGGDAPNRTASSLEPVSSATSPCGRGRPPPYRSTPSTSTPASGTSTCHSSPVPRPVPCRPTHSLRAQTRPATDSAQRLPTQ
jgi:hypothetical protein